MNFRNKVEYGTMGPRAYDLLVKPGYDPEEGKTLGELPPKVTGDKVHGLNKTQKVLQQKGHSIKSPSTGLGYVPKSPLRVLIKRVNNCHISVVEESSTEGQKANKQKSVFLRLGEKVKSHNPIQRRSVFDKLGKPTSNLIKERSEEEESSASCFNIEEGNGGMPERATFLAEQAHRGPHPWEVMKERFMATPHAYK
ncbi:hypothetical protein LIER_06855 [Lithospermum erythrorhizon]|uniref:G-patch domain-containing protein n=1 Tax=Lithospermum erythrorhizon TaxID=34254 RepID=A0AAV3P638_LITER